MIAVTVLLFLVLLRWGLLFVGALFLIARVQDCPACFEPTLKVRRPWLRRLAPWLEWRWCPTCRWQGLSRKEEGGLVRSATRPADPGALFRSDRSFTVPPDVP